MATAPQKITLAHYRSLAALRRALREFLRFSEDAARAAGLPPQQHQALLAIKGFPERDHVSIRELAEHLHVKHHSAVGLVDRLVRRGFVRRRASKTDGRQVEIRLTARGETFLGRISAAHLEELRRLRPELRRIVELIERS